MATDRNFDGKLKDIEVLFKEHLNAFIPLILSPRNILVKKISGNEVKCRDLLRYFRAYVDIFQVCSNYFTVSLYFEPYHLPFRATFGLFSILVHVFLTHFNENVHAYQ